MAFHTSVLIGSSSRSSIASSLPWELSQPPPQAGSYEGRDTAEVTLDMICVLGLRNGSVGSVRAQTLGFEFGSQPSLCKKPGMALFKCDSSRGMGREEQRRQEAVWALLTVSLVGKLANSGSRPTLIQKNKTETDTSQGHTYMHAHHTICILT